MPESTKQRLAFDAYFDLGAERSIERLHTKMRASKRPPSLRTLFEWSRRYRWQDRIARLEQEARRADDDARIQALREMYERHAQEAMLLQYQGAQWLTTMDDDRVTADGAIRAIVEGARMERLARGEPSERTETNGELTVNARLTTISDEELDRLLEFAESAQGREGAAESGRSPRMESEAPHD
jgi:hypothetical protein